MQIRKHSGNKLLNIEYKINIMPENLKVSQKLVSSLTQVLHAHSGCLSGINNGGNNLG